MAQRLLGSTAEADAPPLLATDVQTAQLVQNSFVFEPPSTEDGIFARLVDHGETGCARDVLDVEGQLAFAEDIHEDTSLDDASAADVGKTYDVRAESFSHDKTIIGRRVHERQYPGQY